LEEIGNLFLLTRESAGVSLKEVSEDLNIEEREEVEL
jgi:cytoskeletal protein RodZ